MTQPTDPVDPHTPAEPVIRSEEAFLATFGDDITSNTDDTADTTAADDVEYLRNNDMQHTTVTGGSGAAPHVDAAHSAALDITAVINDEDIARAKRLLAIHTVSSWCALVLGLAACTLVFFTPRTPHLPAALTWIVGVGFLITLIVTATTSALRARDMQALGFTQ